MTTGGFKRKLTAILSADVEGYSRLMDNDSSYYFKYLKFIIKYGYITLQHIEIKNNA